MERLLCHLSKQVSEEAVEDEVKEVPEAWLEEDESEVLRV